MKKGLLFIFSGVLIFVFGFLAGFFWATVNLTGIITTKDEIAEEDIKIGTATIFRGHFINDQGTESFFS